MGNKSISTSVAALVVVIITLTGCRVDQRTEQAFCRLEATVVSPSGETIEGADVIFRRASRGPNDVIAIETTTAKGGCAVDLPVNTAVVLSVMAEGRLLPTVPVLVTPPVSWSNVTVTLARAETDTGERWRFLWAEPLDYLNQCEEIQETTERVVQSWNQEIRRHVDPETGYAEIPEVSKEFVRGRDRLNT